MANRVVLSNEHLDIKQIDDRRRDTEAAIEAYFAIDNPNLAERFFGMSPHEVRTEKETLIEESQRSSSMDLFGALEAAFRVDFLQRCYRREKDEISRAFRDLYRDKGPRVSFEDGILAKWEEDLNVPKRVIRELTNAFKYRHWLAHGRYWRPKFQRLDYAEVYALAEETLASFPFKEG